MLERCDVLARCSEEPGRLTRRFATPALADARELVAGWMREAGLEPRYDAVGNLVGRRDGAGRTLLLGSHLDTVRDAGRYDGPLGVLLALAAADRLRDRPLPFALEVAAFADEEGVRYGTAYLGSAVLAGRFDAAWLDRLDADGVTMADAIRAGAAIPARWRPRPRGLLGYVEAHIEQGPVLEQRGLPVGSSSAIAGPDARPREVHGTAGHAGTTPMDARQDALCGGGGVVLAVEAAGRGTAGLVATVGRSRWSRARRTSFRAGGRLGRRAPRRDAAREAAVRALRERARRSRAARGSRLAWTPVQEKPAVRAIRR